jgi:stearoyl-CoA desaturase (delta-9 desaturase)
MLSISHSLVVRTLQIVAHLLFFLSIYYWNSSYWLLSIFLYYFAGILGINIGYHRLLAHRSFRTYKILERGLSLLGSLAAMGSPLALVAIHRQHHRFSDTELDPHSPHRVGILRSWLGFWGKIEISSMTTKDLRKDNFQKFLHNYYLQINIAYILVLGIIDPLLIIFAWAVPAVLIFHSAGAFDVIAHIQGYRTYETKDQSRNSWIANIITMGEGWHNNHHAKPYAWQQGEKWWELDPPSWIIKLIKN